MKSRQSRISIVLCLIVLVGFSGCQPTQPFYLHTDGDLSHLLDTATEIEYPDVEDTAPLDATEAAAPITLDNPDFDKFWDLTLEEVVSIALQNTKVVRNLGSVTPIGFSDGLVGRINAASTVHDVAITETTPGFRSEQPSAALDGAVRAGQVGGTESALSQFDAQLEMFSGLGGNNASLINVVDQPQNVIPSQFFTQVLNQTTSNVTTQIRKRNASGGTFFLRNITSYDRGNSRGGIDGGNQALESFWTTVFQIEAVQPLMRGRGVLINRIPVTLARMNTDQAIVQFEISVRNLLLDIENIYWDLHCAYRSFETAKVARDSAQGTAELSAVRASRGVGSTQAEAQASERYHTTQAQLIDQFANLLDTERRLRHLMGIAPTDGRVIRPINEPTTAHVEFDWDAIKCETLLRSPELRQIKWSVKQREQELILAKNQLLPRLDFRATLGIRGSGDHLINADRNGLNFPAAGSTAFDELFENKYQEASIGFDFVPNRFGQRRELSAVRNAELLLTRSRVQLEDAQINAVNVLEGALLEVSRQYHQLSPLMARVNKVNEDYEQTLLLYEQGIRTENAAFTLDRVLEAQQRRANAENDYYRALCQYNKAIASVHAFKGSLMEYNSVHLAEGPWPKKAYWDALAQARERDASYFVDYGWTRPNVVSRGAMAQQYGNDGTAATVGDIPTPTMAPQVISPEAAEGETLPQPRELQEPEELQLPEETQDAEPKEQPKRSGRITLGPLNKRRSPNAVAKWRQPGKVSAPTVQKAMHLESDRQKSPVQPAAAVKPIHKSVTTRARLSNGNSLRSKTSRSSNVNPLR